MLCVDYFLRHRTGRVLVWYGLSPSAALSLGTQEPKWTDPTSKTVSVGTHSFLNAKFTVPESYKNGLKWGKRTYLQINKRYMRILLKVSEIYDSKLYIKSGQYDRNDLWHLVEHTGKTFTFTFTNNKNSTILTPLKNTPYPFMTHPLITRCFKWNSLWLYSINS